MIKDKTFDQLSVACKFVHHMHDFYHMQVDGFICNFDDIDCVNNDINKLVGQLRVQFGAEGSSGNTDKQWFLNSLFCYFEGLQKLQCFFTG